MEHHLYGGDGALASAWSRDSGYIYWSSPHGTIWVLESVCYSAVLLRNLSAHVGMTVWPGGMWLGGRASLSWTRMLFCSWSITRTSGCFEEKRKERWLRNAIYIIQYCAVENFSVCTPLCWNTTADDYFMHSLLAESTFHFFLLRYGWFDRNLWVKYDESKA